MTGKKGQKWTEKKNRYPVKLNTVVTQKVGDAIEEEAEKKERSISDIIRRALEKIFG